MHAFRGPGDCTKGAKRARPYGPRLLSLNLNRFPFLLPFDGPRSGLFTLPRTPKQLFHVKPRAVKIHFSPHRAGQAHAVAEFTPDAVFLASSAETRRDPRSRENASFPGPGRPANEPFFAEPIRASPAFARFRNDSGPVYPGVQRDPRSHGNPGFFATKQ